VPVCLCAGLYVANGGSRRQLSLEIQVLGTPNADYLRGEMITSSTLNLHRSSRYGRAGAKRGIAPFSAVSTG
jgi:hypothetical protein